MTIQKTQKWIDLLKWARSRLAAPTGEGNCAAASVTEDSENNLLPLPLRHTDYNVKRGKGANEETRLAVAVRRKMYAGDVRGAMRVAQRRRFRRFR